LNAIDMDTDDLARAGRFDARERARQDSAMRLAAAP
jgi:hypothetical protein